MRRRVRSRRTFILPDTLAHQLLLGEREMPARRRWGGHFGCVAVAGTRLWAQSSHTRSNGCHCKLLPETSIGPHGTKWQLGPHAAEVA